MAVLYLKYRPKSLDQIIGQKGVKDALSLAYKVGSLSHAYLFSGPRGTGKTSTARIMAKMVNCEGKETPCNTCETCLSITDGSNLDLIEIDAASNRGIDDIRTLRENIKLAPSGSKKKVYIVDEAHMLTTEAFNALLKTLEEPPLHTLFILATTDPEKIPQTILSRVTRLDFKLASQVEILEALKVVAEGEKIKIEDAALKLIAKKAGGSFRDAVKYLDQLGSLAKEIKVKDIEEVLSTGNFELAFDLLQNLAQGRVREALILVFKQQEAGVPAKEFSLFLMDILRNAFYIKNNLGTELVKDAQGSEDYQKLTDLTNKFSLADLIKTLNILQAASEKIKIASIPYLPLELAVVEICGDLMVDNRNLKIDLEAGESKLEEKKQDARQVQASITERPVSISNLDISKLSDHWTYVLETVRQNNFSLEALLRGAKILGWSEGVISIEVPYAFHQRILEQPKNRDLLEAVITDVLSEPVKIVTVLGSRPQRIEDIANVELAKEDEILTLAADIFNGKLVD
ncbi:DNA polymerase III, subunit gamma and tau [Candidatus Daviesbacteria bacterium RIFCSPHIGHO2_12_FULL_37_11]|uniref:DNA polymerase III subunit gamma/tau n=1 Tax=Candidatus Daviesbacteria bacterium RIFCSPHIGHO2_12_FULL_37_11 TaxID=1797777 RepID=A0A1F5KA43_9BACT|nr:MAG: DNA polymerase III, subunit gamma and tau [Candidatus Daviesbacteria bacterium RIFCSPHIGHO2_01_FULL_37_27]OGE37678.1 MAG: DNA polymerase III, subunit gamma and tau [Candidatus Daviesbacteria bacterium RIFCSPHIGHO2_12_FULL_37_11]OGE45433.1 MAG: DNA polymerase III, subunit gamma and tau [Candidatus Daviesbacteria bacterium RIFCSPLOWO2_01_FULL_37_10]